ncbi:MAG: hypothetical protein ACR2G3_00875 [Solirubrobacterales bacterium]
MTGKADFTDEEWEQVLEGPPAAGLLVSIAERGGTFREAFSIAKAYGEAAKHHGGSELMDEVLATKPKVDRTRHGDVGELREHSLTHLRSTIALLESKATSEEVEGYRGFILAVAERVAAAKEEGDAPVSDAEQTAIGDVAVAIGSPAPE